MNIILNLLQDFGPLSVRELYVIYLQNKIWEIRLKDTDGIARVIYILEHKKRIILLHAFMKKAQKTPKEAIEIALKKHMRSEMSKTVSFE